MASNAKKTQKQKIEEAREKALAEQKAYFKMKATQALLLIAALTVIASITCNQIGMLRYRYEARREARTYELGAAGWSTDDSPFEYELAKISPK